MTKLIKIIIFFSLFVLLLSAGATYYFYTKSKQATENLSPNLSPKAPVSDIDLSKSPLFSQVEVDDNNVLPQEKPLIFPVSDFENLKDQPFLSDAKPEYQVFIYQKEQKAALYDPTSRRIIRMAELVIITPTPEDQLEIAPSPTKNTE